jgi:hypothetical protein
LLKSALQTRPVSQERRRHQRVKVVLLGRFMLENREEYPCQTLNMSPGGVAVLAPVKGRPGERVVMYIEHLGRLEGQVARVFDLGFAVMLSATKRKQDKLADQLTWLANRHDLGLPEDRRHDRIVPRQTGTIMRLADGREVGVRIIDISLSGTAISSAVVPPLGTPVTIGRQACKVVRHFEGGFAVEFLRALNIAEFDESIRL